MGNGSLDAEIAAAERAVERVQSQLPVEHPAYSLLGAALANLSEAAFEIQEN